MSPEQKMLVKSTWTQVVPIADVAATLFYDRLFTVEPSLRTMFANTDMKEQRSKLLRALATVVHGLDDLSKLVPTLEHLGRNHARYGVTDQHYDIVGGALLWTLEQGLKSAWTPPVKSAWTAAYTAIATVMRNAVKGVASAA